MADQASRKASVERTTRETDIRLHLDLDGEGRAPEPPEPVEAPPEADEAGGEQGSDEPVEDADGNATTDGN